MPNICGSSVCNLRHVIILVPRILRLLPDFWKFVDTCPNQFETVCSDVPVNPQAVWVFPSPVRMNVNHVCYHPQTSHSLLWHHIM